MQVLFAQKIGRKDTNGWHRVNHSNVCAKEVVGTLSLSSSLVVGTLLNVQLRKIRYLVLRDRTRMSSSHRFKQHGRSRPKYATVDTDQSIRAN